MTPEQIVALLQVIADLRLQLGAVLAENAELRARLAGPAAVPDSGTVPAT